ncbi:hypothetical protein RB653_003228 [Dictyostelium firmibasis]|uniref:Uncharacterized protein n=1 Tax=Dictyostelium firmibasis TaxID=79012 RepID=A0AAN7YW89_9MYCE
MTLFSAITSISKSNTSSKSSVKSFDRSSLSMGSNSVACGACDSAKPMGGATSLLANIDINIDINLSILSGGACGCN